MKQVPSASAYCHCFAQAYGTRPEVLVTDAKLGTSGQGRYNEDLVQGKPARRSSFGSFWHGGVCA